MVKQDGVRGQNGFALLFKSVVWVDSFDDPSCIVRVVSIHACLLVTDDWRVDGSALWSAAQIQFFAVGVGRAFNFNFLAITNDIVRSEDVDFLSTFDDEHGPADGSWRLSSRGEHVRLEETWAFVAEVHYQESCCLFVLNHDRVSRTEDAIR